MQSDLGPNGDDSLVREDLLKLLANDTRMQILQVLWEEFTFHRYVVHDQEPLSFSELLHRTAIEDSGNLNYHLGKLTSAFLTKREGGYVLTPLGYNLMRSITTYASFDYQTFEPTELDDPCPFCGGVLLAKYERELVHTYCRDCRGLAGGNINYVNLPAVDINRRDLVGILDAATTQLMSRVRSIAYGLCGTCHGRVEPTVTLCETHALGPEGACADCDRRFGADILFECPHCGAEGAGPLVEYALVSPRVESFFEAYDRGPRDVGPFRYRLACLESAIETIASESGDVEFTFTLESESERMKISVGGDKLAI